MRLFPAIALSAALLTSACATPDGQFDPGATVALTAGLAAVGGLLFIASQDSGPRYHGGGYGGGGYRGGRPSHGGRGGWR